MIDLLAAEHTLKQIYDSHIKLHDAIRFTLAQDDYQYVNKQTLTTLVVSELKHQFFIEEIMKENNISVDKNNPFIIKVALANNLFSKKLKSDLVTKYILKKDSDENLKLLLTFNGDIHSLLKLNHNSLEYVSCIFNVPVWVLKSWTKSYGTKDVFKELKALKSPFNKTYRVNTMKCGEDKIIERNPSCFEKTLTSNILKYVGKEPVNSINDYRKFCLFQEVEIMKVLVDNYINDFSTEFSVYSGEDDSLPRELFVKANNKSGLNIIVPSLDDRATLLRMIRLSNSKNVNLFEASSLAQIQTGLTSSQQCVFVYPKSTSFDNIKDNPDFFARLNQNDLDSIIKNQTELLSNMSKFIDFGGYLIYIVNILSKKESTLMISDFLDSHRDFELVEAAQHMLHQTYKSMFYYAVLKRKELEEENA